MLKKDCEVCELLPSNNPTFESEYWMATLSPDQGYLGRAYVTIKEHEGSLAELSHSQWQDFADMAKRYETAVTEAFGATLFNWGCLMNHAYQEDNPTPHVHWHVRPRYQEDVELLGRTFTDPDFGQHYDRKHSYKASQEQLQKISAIILRASE
jgi:diadenosine tetraphosphate (Ap4A) HIT family hydrolase